MKTLLLLLLLLPLCAFGQGYGGGYFGGYLPASGYFDISVLEDVDLITLGDDILPGEWMTLDPDFSSGTKYYFDSRLDPTEDERGDGTRTDPFYGLGYEAFADTVIERRASLGGAVENSANSPVVAANDVCVLLHGSHGKLQFNRYYFGDYLGIVGLSGATFDYIKINRGRGFYFENLTANKNPRISGFWTKDGVDVATSTDTTAAGYDEVPYFVHATRDTNGNGVASNIIFKDLTLSTATTAEADTWLKYDWRQNAVGGILTQRSDSLQIQDNTGEVLTYGIKPVGASSTHNLHTNVFNNNFKYMSGDGISNDYSEYVHVKDNIVFDFFLADSNHVDMIQFGNTADNILVERNWAAQYTDLARSFTGAFNGVLFPTIGTSNDIRVRNNIFYIGQDYTGINIRGGDNIIIDSNDVLPLNFAAADTMPFIGITETSTGDSYVQNNIGCATYSAETGVTYRNNSLYARALGTAGFADYDSLASPLLHDLSLLVTSENVDAGIAFFAPDEDFNGDCRPKGSAHDIGAYEYDDGGDCSTYFTEFTSILAAFDSLGNVGMQITATTNNLAKIKHLWRELPNAPGDTALVAWDQTLATDHSGRQDSGIAAATAAADSGGILLSWTAPASENLDGIIIEFDQGLGNDFWTLLTAIGDPDYLTVDTFTHNENDSPVPEPRRGGENYRAYAFSVDGGDTTTYQIAIIPNLFYNQAVEVASKYHADDGSTIAESGEVSELLISYPAEGDPTFFMLTVDADSVSGSVDHYDFRMLITADNFPDDVKDSDISYALASGAGGIRFTDAFGDSIPYDRVSFEPASDPANATAEIWIWPDTVSYNVDTDIKVSFNAGDLGHPAADATYGSEAVWANDYVGVWHMSQDPSGGAPQILDSTANGYHGTSAGTMLTEDLVSGSIGSAIDFDGTDDLIAIPSGMEFTTSMTLSVWNNSGNNFSTGLFGNWDNWIIKAGGSAMFLTTNGGSQVNAGNLSLYTGEHRWIGTYNGTTATLYRDTGGYTGSAGQTGSLTGAAQINIGRGETQFWDGVIDEVRAGTFVATPDLIATEYSNQKYPATFAIEGVPE